MQQLKILLQQPNKASEIYIGNGIRRDLGQVIHNTPALRPRQLAVISNKRVFGLYGKQLTQQLKRDGFTVSHWLMPEGERYKSFGVLANAVEFLGENFFERNDAVVALGGGVVGDLAGFSAAIYLRGIPLIQMPTTLLAQIDSSVGGKTGINLAVGKNLVGSFHQPRIVVVDVETLTTLPERELTSGFCEMIKQALVASPLLFDRTTRLLRDWKGGPDNRFSGLQDLIALHCEFKASIVAEDEQESTTRLDKRSRKVLNLGHTTAHALETLTNYRAFRHGEAVGYGLLVAGELSKNLGLLSETELESIQSAVALCGSLPRADNLDVDEIMRLVKRDKKTVAGQINWVLLDDIGSPRIVPGKEISSSLLRRSLRQGLQALRKKEFRTNEQAKIKPTR
jgi:3-dehydroquinate synthase